MDDRAEIERIEALLSDKTLSQEQIEHIHRASLEVIETLGVDMWSDEGLDIFDAAGAEVDRANRHVRMDRALIEDAVAKAPAEVTLTPRNPARQLILGGDRVVFTSVGGPPNVHDAERGRRPGNIKDYGDLLRLIQSLEVVHCIGNQPVAPTDLPAESRHLDCYLANLTLTDRVFLSTSIGAERVRDAVEMLAIVRGVSLEELAERPAVISNINVNSPRRVDGAMAAGLMALARYGQVVVVTPFTLMGAMAPVTLAAALVQQNAEALAGIALVQMVRPGNPVIYGAFTSNVDMRSGAPAFGTPENTLATLAGGQLARRYGLPYRSSNASASNVVDAQAAYESQMSIWGAVLGGANVVYHAAGWMEGGLTASFEKFVLDAEMLQMMSEVLRPIVVDEASLGLDAIREVQPGGHFFGAAHTLARYETAFYQPMLSDWRNYETWAEDGARSATERATAIWKDLLRSYQQPPLDPGIVKALEAYVRRRKEEIARQAA
ncbi:MAG: trimethylamine methyltransferase family protein [Proteobacteria bacterium]|nr:trimethylamine methyltransferase family protein [Pseudomonadota bacterium]